MISDDTEIPIVIIEEKALYKYMRIAYIKYDKISIWKMHMLICYIRDIIRGVCLYQIVVTEVLFNV